MRVLLIFPTIFEGQAFFKKAGKKAVLGTSASILISGIEFEGVVSGIGCGASKERLRAFIENQNFDLAMLCGFCGSTKKDFKEGDFLFDTLNNNVAKILVEVGACACKIACEKKVANAEKKLELCRNGFGAVDMEADYFKPLFNEEKFVHLRAVSDGVDSKIPAEFFTALMDFDTGSSSFSVAKFFKLMLKNPSLPFVLIGFARSANRAKKIYEKKLFELMEKLADFYLQKQADF